MIYRTTPLLILFTILICTQLNAQITIESCQQKAYQNYPLINRFELIKKSEEFTLANANRNYLPQLSLSAKASYQSDVVKFPINIPGMEVPTLSKDQYGIEATLSQTIWDGGAVRGYKEQSRAAAAVEKRETERALYQIKDRVNELYFGVLLLDAQLDRLELFEEELERNHKQVSSYIKQGVANSTDLDVVRVEMLNTKQNRAQLRANRRAFIEILSLFIGEDIVANQEFEPPTLYQQPSRSQINRPELQLFDAKVKELESRKKSIRTSIMPKFNAFITGGYGRPALNMLKDKFDPYYVAGVGMSWNFGGLYTKKRDFKKIGLAQSGVNIERELFMFNTNIEFSQEDNVTSKNKELLKYDDEIISLRTNIRRAAEAKLENGAISTMDFMRELLAEDLARQQKIEHQIELLMSIYRQRYITNAN